MSFLDFLGECLGEMAAQGQEMQSYKSQYEQMSSIEIKIIITKNLYS